MTTIFLQDIIEDSRFEDLPPSWNSFDLETFSKSKRLWDYQQKAVENGIKVLCRYFEDDDIVFFGKEEEGKSGRLERCIRIGEYRPNGRYYLEDKIQEEWGEPEAIFLQRGPHRHLCHPERFYKWLTGQEIRLMKRNNLD